MSKAGGKQLSIRPSVLYAGFAGLLATNALTLVGFLMAPDISHLLAGQTQTVFSAYEDRIAQLRLEVDRLQSRHYSQAGDINLQLQELAQTQEVLQEQHQFVKQLADKAAALGITATPGQKDTAPRSDSDASLVTGSITPAAAGAASDPETRVAEATASVNQMMSDSKLALAALSDAASTKTDQIVGSLATVGIQTKLPSGDLDGEGGPLLAPIDGPEDSTLIDDANGVAVALDRYAAAKQAADIAPIHKPVLADVRISSIFGNRKDPFTGRLAFHPGIDFAAYEGTTVVSAGAGTVSFVGQISGYGNAIEVTHADGLVSLYGHLSAFIAKEGDVVDVGTPIGRVGSTGRSTGPHLHFEVRRGDDPVNPAPYLSAGAVVEKIMDG